jgi:hypothetical protein
LAAFIFDGGNLKVFVTFGVDVLEKGDLAFYSDILIGLYLGNVLVITKIDIAVGEVVEKVLVGVNFKFVKFLESFWTDAG